ncbi:MAG: hypothetical protein FJ090_00435 [Deltaproteobacteria bacterium]|nr:hypothetical protein [Deltaproteobacteria bacterium]
MPADLAPAPLAQAEIPAPPPVASAPPPLPEGVTAERAYERLLARLDEAARLSVRDVSFAIGLEAGTLRVGVRKPMWRDLVRDTLGRLDLAALVSGLRRVEVVIDDVLGRTGREARSDADLGRRAAAREAAGRSEAVKRLLAAFDAEIEDIEPTGKEPPVFAHADPEVHDDEGAARS